MSSPWHTGARAAGVWKGVNGAAEPSPTGGSLPVLDRLAQGPRQVIAVGRAQDVKGSLGAAVRELAHGRWWMAKVPQDISPLSRPDRSRAWRVRPPSIGPQEAAQESRLVNCGQLGADMDRPGSGPGAVMTAASPAGGPAARHCRQNLGLRPHAACPGDRPGSGISWTAPGPTGYPNGRCAGS